MELACGVDPSLLGDAQHGLVHERKFGHLSVLPLVEGAVGAGHFRPVPRRQHQRQFRRAAVLQAPLVVLLLDRGQFSEFHVVQGHYLAFGLFFAAAFACCSLIFIPC